MLAIALGLKAVDAGHRVYYTTAAELVARSARAASQGRWSTTMNFWAGPALLIVDELGYLPLMGEAAAHLFQVISHRYDKGSIILTTNRGIAKAHTFQRRCAVRPQALTGSRTRTARSRRHRRGSGVPPRR